MRGRLGLGTILFALALLPAPQAAAAKFFLSTTGGATLPGQTFANEDGVIYDSVTDTTTLVFDGSNVFSGNENVDAFHLYDDGTILLSTTGNAQIGTLPFGDDDIVHYDPNTGTATLVFDGGALFSNVNEDVDAVSVFSNGNLLISTEGGATLGGLTFSDGDLVEYDLVNDVATLYFSETLFAANEDVDGAHVRPDGTLLISTRGNASLAGLGFGDDDIIFYDPVAAAAFLEFDGGANFSNADEDINALSVPEPALLALLAPALLLRRRR